MIETTNEFMVRFRATGLDMLCEARRRAKQAVPFYGTVTGRMSFKHPAFDWPYGLHRSIWKSAAVGKSFIDPEAFNTFPARGVGRDFVDLEMRVLTSLGSFRNSMVRLDRTAMAAAALLCSTTPTLDGWRHIFNEPVPQPHEWQERQLWPGVKAQVEGERRVNVKRVARDRLKKKLAKKRK